MTIGSLFAGVGGFDLAFERAGFETRWSVEIDDRARSVFARHFPNAQLFTDVRNVGAHNLEPVDVIVGGFPCQDLSVAGKRAGLDGERSGLFYELARIVAELSPDWLCLENVPGLLSSNGGRDMGSVIGTLGELGYGVCWRVLDAQHFGVPQRRRRVFIVGHSGGRCPVEVLFEPESLRGDTAAGEEAREGFAGAAGGGPGERCVATLTSRSGTPDRGDTGANSHLIAERPLAGAVSCKWAKGTGGPSGDECQNLIAASVTASAGHHGHSSPCGDGSDNLVVGINNRGHDTGVTVGTLRSDCHGANPMAFTCQGSNVGEMGTLRAGNGHVSGGVPFTVEPFGVPGGDVGFALRANPSHSGDKGDGGINTTLVAAQAAMTVRRLMPVECERLQGFPDGWTEVGADGERMADSTRYRQMGNAVAVPVVEWIARRMRKEAIGDD